MSQWISVKEELPENNQEVIATDGRHIFAGIGTDCGEVFANCYDLICYCPPKEFGRVTHWMPVPEIPKMR